MSTLESHNLDLAIPAERPRASSLGWLGRAGRRAVVRALGGLRHGRIRLVDGIHDRVFGDDPGDRPAIRVRVLDDRFYACAALGGALGVAEAYIDGYWTADDLPGLVELLTLNLTTLRSLDGLPARFASSAARIAYWLERNSRAGSRRNIRAHYDLGNEFFALFLDPSMTYSSAIFESGAATLERAQFEKIDRACRRLDLQPADHLLEIGTGWGALAVHAASRYGCRVTTTTISDRQFDFAARLVRERGLADRITVLKQDYRDLRGVYDKLVSIEMVEAVGRRHLGDYLEVCSRCLSPRGAALIQAIVIRDQFFEPASRRRDFLKKYIFPGSCLPGLAAMSSLVAARTDLRTWHLEDFGPHYATTLAIWRERFMARLAEVRSMGFDDRFIRMWEYYFAYCEGAFRARHVGVVQWLLVKPLSRAAPVGTSHQLSATEARPGART